MNSNVTAATQVHAKNLSNHEEHSSNRVSIRRPAYVYLLTSEIYISWQSLPRVHDVKYSRRDRCSILRMEVRVGLQKLQPWVIKQQLPDKWLQIVLHRSAHHIRQGKTNLSVATSRDSDTKLP